MSSTRVERRIFPRPDFPQFGWIGAAVPPPAGFDAAFWPAIEGETRSVVLPKRKADSTSLRQDTPAVDWLQANPLWEVPYFAAPYALAHMPRAPQHVTDTFSLRQDQPGLSWLTAALALWEVPYGVPPKAQELSFRTQHRQADRVFIRQDTPRGDWIGAVVPPPAVFDPALWSAIELLSRAFRMRARTRDRVFIRQDTPAVDWLQVRGLWEVPYHVPVRDQALSFRQAQRATDITSLRQDQPQMAWLKEPLTLWEVQYAVSAWSQMQSFRARERQTDTTYIRQAPLAVAFGQLPFGQPPPEQLAKALIAPLFRLINEQSATVTRVPASISTVTLLAANAERRMAIIYNDSTANLYVKFGVGASTTSFTIKLAQDQWIEFPLPVYSGVVTGVWSAVDGAACITEIT